MIIRKTANTGLILSLFFMLGCAHIPFVGKSVLLKTGKKSDSPEKPVLKSNLFVKKGRIIDGQRLQQKQNIVIVPFTAGVGVVADEESDKIALMIVKGISDAFAYDQSGKHKQFTILTAENSQKANLLVQGHITDMKSSSKVSRWVLLKRKEVLGVEGKMVDAQTREDVLIFKDQVEAEIEKEGYKPLGYRIGKNIGKFILSGVK